MLRPKTTIDFKTNGIKLDELGAAVRREAAKSESDPFDEAMVAAVLGVVETMKAEGQALSELEVRLRTLARKA